MSDITNAIPEAQTPKLRCLAHRRGDHSPWDTQQNIFGTRRRHEGKGLGWAPAPPYRTNTLAAAAQGGTEWSGLRDKFGTDLKPEIPPRKVSRAEHPPCDIPSGCCSFTGPWTVTRSSLRMLRRVAAFCRPLRPVLPLVSFPRSRSPVVWCAGAVLDVAGCAVCASAAPNNWRIGGCAGCCRGRLTAFAAPPPPPVG